jgi:FixJ family two-component response regulator
VVLLDIDFSKTHESGVDILKAIRKLGHLPKVLVLTGHCEVSLIDQLQREGANAYRLKNIALAELRQTILDVYAGDMVFKYDSKMVNDNRNMFFEIPPFLSDRAVEIIRLLSQGYIVKEIAQKLGIADTTVNDHLERTKRNWVPKTMWSWFIWPGRGGVYINPQAPKLAALLFCIIDVLLKHCLLSRRNHKAGNFLIVQAVRFPFFHNTPSFNPKKTG